MRKHTSVAAILVCWLLAANTAVLAQASNGADREAPPMTPEAVRVPASQPSFIPMTGGQRLSQYFKDTFSPASFVTSGASAGIGQWRDRPMAWKQGAEGYGRRYASSYAEHIARETPISGASSVLHEDNRFIPSGQAGAGNRVKYAVASAFLARHDDGTRHLSITDSGTGAKRQFELAQEMMRGHGQFPFDFVIMHWWKSPETNSIFKSHRGPARPSIQVF
jgi:hypothetical protein